MSIKYRDEGACLTCRKNRQALTRGGPLRKKTEALRSGRGAATYLGVRVWGAAADHCAKIARKDPAELPIKRGDAVA
jgi:hypothetical protein